ncbi:hypothetical protein F0562_003071 [Nyssa sinensis]|uniref:AP2/ERF domain-containing protein n=1 Tax=Nyssa sinensis TaxID=561372 RepID=A0A5J5BV66_9ASTE|nr:hypothetical protein F0562_003071 [Nyssa sinensis]
MEMLSSSSQSQLLQSTIEHAPFDGSSPESQDYYFIDDFYASEGDSQVKEGTRQSNIGDSCNYTSYFDSEIQHPAAPKLEDFLRGDASSLIPSQTETHDSSLTHIYDQGGSAYFSDHQDFKSIAATPGFPAFSTNSGSEVDDSASVASTQLSCGEFVCQSIESAFPPCPAGALSLDVNTLCSEKAIVSVDDSENSNVDILVWLLHEIWGYGCYSNVNFSAVYLGGYDKEEKAARAYDLAALKYWGPTAIINFPVSNYNKELEDMKNVSKQEFIASLRRKSSGFSRGASIYRGVTRHHQQGRWQARIGRVAGNKDLYLGTFATEEEAAEAYDIAAIKFRGANAVTNFEMSRYDFEAIVKSVLPVGGAAKRLKLSLPLEQKPALNHDQQSQCSINSNNNAAIQPVSAIPCGVSFGTSDTHGPAPSFLTPMSLLPSPADQSLIWPRQSY